MEEEKITPTEISNLSKLTTKSNEIAQNIVDEDNVDVLKKLIQLFNIQETKKDTLRVLKYNDLLDKISEEMSRRFDKNKNMFTNDDLLKYLQVIQGVSSKTSKLVSSIEETPNIVINQVNIQNEEQPPLTRESREKIDDFLKVVFEKLKSKEPEDVENEIVVEPTSEEENNKIEGNGEDNGENLWNYTN